MQATDEQPAIQTTELSALVNPGNDGAIDAGVNLANTIVAIVKEVGELLTSVPYVKSLSGVVLQIIKIREEIKSNKERCREIIEKVLRISKSIYERLAEVAKSKGKDKLTRLEGHLGDCQRPVLETLSAVCEVLEKHRSRRRFAKLINRGLDELNTMDRRVDELNIKLILDILVDIRLEQAASTTREEQSPAEGYAIRVSQNNKLLIRQLTSGPDHVLPPKLYFMVERESHFKIALEVLLRAESSRIAILGGGGFGKTTLARTLLHEPTIRMRYQLRYFLSCEGMADVDSLLLGFGMMLGIKATPSAILAASRRILATSTTLLCFDNFETPWEPSTTRTKIEDVLASVADIPNLSLMITIRGTQRPSKVAWSRPLLSPLSTLSSDGARLILQEICPEHISDDFTKKLLDAVEGIPLAITLIANLLRDGETSRALWTRWSKEQTTAIENGGDGRESNLDASVALSVSSPRMKKDPGAMALLAALSLLPDGFSLAEIDQLEEHLGLAVTHRLLQTLRAVALIKPDPSPRIQMLSPIRLFCIRILSSDIPLVLEKVINYYIKVMLSAKGKRNNSDVYARVIPEIPNIQSVFQRGYKSGYSQINRLIDATVTLTYWSHTTGYFTHDTIQMALERSTDFPLSHAECLYEQGSLHYTEGDNSKAKACFAEAVDLFKQLNDPLGQARGLRRIGDVLSRRQQLDQAEVILKTSRDLYIQAENAPGQADVAYSLGKLYIHKYQYSEAKESLTAALEGFQRIQDFLGQSNAANNLSMLYIIIGNLAKSAEFATEALDAAKRANYARGEGNALLWLGCIYILIDRVADARQALEKALSIHKQKNDVINQLNAVNSLGKVYLQSDQLSVAEVLLTEFSKMELDVIEIPEILTTLGWLYICGNRLDKAAHHLDRALELFRKFGDKCGQAMVLSHLGNMYLKSNRLDDAERVLKSILNLGRWRRIEIRRRWVLGELYIVKGHLEDAEAVLNSATARCQDREESYSHQQGSITRSMGTLNVKRGDFDQAIEKFKEACRFHQKAQWVSEQATDLKRLGEVYEMVGRSEEAGAAFKEVEVLMETVRESRVLSEL